MRYFAFKRYEPNLIYPKNCVIRTLVFEVTRFTGDRSLVVSSQFINNCTSVLKHLFFRMYYIYLPSIKYSTGFVYIYELINKRQLPAVTCSMNQNCSHWTNEKLGYQWGELELTR